MLFTKFHTRDHRPPRTSLNSGISLQYLGTAGFVFSSQNRDIVVDPFISRPSVRDCLLRPLESNVELLKEIIPKADDVLVGHSHHDHILDAPQLCMNTGARFIGSSDSCRIASAAGLPPHQILESNGREIIECGEDCSVMGIPSRHGKVYFNQVTMAGSVPKHFSWPARITDFRHGLVLNWRIEMEGLRIIHIDSADFIEQEVQGQQADVLCLCAIGRRWRRNYVQDAVRIFRPKMIIACHWDWFCSPFVGSHSLLPGVDLPGFVQEIEAEGVEAVVLPIGEKILL